MVIEVSKAVSLPHSTWTLPRCIQSPGNRDVSSFFSLVAIVPMLVVEMIHHSLLPCKRVVLTVTTVIATYSPRGVAHWTLPAVVIPSVQLWTAGLEYICKWVHISRVTRFTPVAYMTICVKVMIRLHTCCHQFKFGWYLGAGGGVFSGDVVCSVPVDRLPSIDI